MADPLLAEIRQSSRSKKFFEKSRIDVLCCLLLLVKYADKVNWVHDPASLAGESIGRGRGVREGKIFEGVDNSTSQEEGWMSGERCSRRCRRRRDGPVRATS
jgi:hypothetical protein